MYACLKCGYVHKGIDIRREREDYDYPTCGPASSSEFHGYKTYRICPKCKSKYTTKIEEDVEVKR